MKPIATADLRLVRIFRDRNPQGSGLVWCLEWNDGKKEYTADCASGPNRFPLAEEMRLHQHQLNHKLTARYRKLEYP